MGGCPSALVVCGVGGCVGEHGERGRMGGVVVSLIYNDKVVESCLKSFLSRSALDFQCIRRP